VRIQLNTHDSQSVKKPEENVHKQIKVKRSC